MNSAQRLKLVGSATFKQLLEQKSEDAQRVGIFKAIAAETVKVLDEAKRQVEFVITTGDVDREQDIISVDGWDFNNYLRNPVVLFGHDYYAPPVARAMSVAVESGKVKSVAEFTPQDLSPFGFMIFRMYALKFMNAVSVGFRPMEYTFADDRKFGINFIKQELLEYSAVPVPANPHALAEARSMGVDLAPMKSWCERTLDIIKRTPESDTLREHIERLRVCADPTGAPLVSILDGVKAWTADAGVPPAADANADAPSKAEDEAVKVTRIVSEHWLCGVDDHEHTTEADARECRLNDAGASAAIEAIVLLTSNVKAGRVLSRANEERLRAAQAQLSEVLAQLDSEDESNDDSTADADKEAPLFLSVVEPEKKEEGYVVDPSSLRAAIEAAVTGELNALTGRVD